MYESVLDTIGRTPVVRLGRIAPPHVKLYAKLEAANPGGSVKDRLALGVIEDAERSGALEPGQTVVEATSGNTGIALAMVCAAKGYPLVVVMAENFSVERRRLMRMLGARVVLTPAALKGSGMLAKARELAEAHGWFWCRQFENPANAEMHARTTAREILDDFEGRRLDWFVCGAGTGGTLNGVGRVLRRERPDCRILVCEPDNAPVLAGGIGQPRLPDGGPAASHPAFRPHVMQGWSPDFIPLLTEQAREAGCIDGVLPVAGDAAMDCARELACREGILAGITAGATLAGALRIAREAEPGATLLVLLPDTGERYLSTPLFEPIPADMDEAEWEIARSTPSARFDVAADSAPPAPESAPDGEADAWLAELLQDREQPVLMFALGWCEFCWSVRKLFDRCGIPHRVVAVDDPAWSRDDRGARLRARLGAHSGSATLPQVFVAGEFLGGCSETFEALRSGQLPRRLQALGVPCDVPPGLEPESLLPGWLQSRSAPD